MNKSKYITYTTMALVAFIINRNELVYIYVR